MKRLIWLTLLGGVTGLLVPMFAALSAAQENGSRIFERDNLVAWCIVPFDAAKRGPDERAQMLRRLSLKKMAYDWRQEHVPTFEDEILAYRRHGIEFFAFWDQHDEMFRLFEKYKISPQVWKIIPPPTGATQQEKVESSARQLLPLVERTRKLGCKLGLYNHGGWSGEPANMVAVCRTLRDQSAADHVGIVYNFHHGHDHIHDFQAQLELMKPFLLCVNINGMNEGANPKILPVGDGQHEIQMLRTLQQAGYQGPIGILGHREELDAELSLHQNLNGIEKILPQLRD
jgi:hypothetical protein